MISEARANLALGYEFGKRAFTPANTYYLGLSLTPISNTGTGFTEPNVSTGYKRVTITNNTTSWAAPSSRVVSNAIMFTFDTFTTTLVGQEITHWFLSESATGGNAIYYGALANPRPVIIDSQIWINVGELKIERANQS